MLYIPKHIVACLQMVDIILKIMNLLKNKTNGRNSFLVLYL